MADENAPALSWPFKNLTREALIEIDRAAGAILDDGFGSLTVQIEFGSMKRIIQTVSRKMDIPLYDAA